MQQSLGWMAFSKSVNFLMAEGWPELVYGCIGVQTALEEHSLGVSTIPLSFFY